MYNKLVKLILCVAVGIHSPGSITVCCAQGDQNVRLSQNEGYLDGLATKYGLGPDSMEKALEETSSYVKVMDCYAMTLLKKTPINIDSSQILQEVELKTTVDGAVKHQNVAKKNAEHWLDEVRYDVQNFYEMIINFVAQFDVQYDEIYAALITNDNDAFKNALTYLYGKLDKHVRQAVKLHEKLKNFREKLIVDNQSFQEDVNQLSTMSKSMDAASDLLTKQMEQCYEQNYENVIQTVVGSIIFPISVVALPIGLGVALYFVSTGIIGIQDSEEKCKRLTQKIGEYDQKKIWLQGVCLNQKYLLETVSKAVDRLQNIKNNLNTIKAKYNCLLGDIEDLSTQQLEYVKADLMVAKRAWNSISENAKKQCTSTSLEIQ